MIYKYSTCLFVHRNILPHGSKMTSFIALSLLLVANTLANPIDPEPTEPPTPAPPTGRRPPVIPTLEDLVRGVAAGDPSDRYEGIIEMVNGKVSEKSKELWEQYMMAHSTEHDGYNEGHENEIYRGQIAYNRLIEAVANGDAETAKTAYEQAEDFMEENGLTMDDVEKAATSSNSGGRDRRYLLKQNNALWDKCIIPFEYGSGYTSYSNVEGPMKTIEYYTGFRFVLWNSSVPSLYGLSHNNRLTYVESNGCWSYVGNLRWNGQNIACCSGSTCVHEIGHSIGFMHEHQNPLRDNYLRTEWTGIDGGYWNQYYRTSRLESVTYGYYDPTSVMHYWNGGFGINYKDTFTTLDPDRDFLVARDTKYFYFFKEAMMSHNCYDLFCSEELDCQNGGYASVIGGECTCFCPEGLDPATLCATALGNDVSPSMAWPSGSFTILNSVNGCPDNFVRGWQYQKPPNYVWGSTKYHATPYWQWYHVEHEYCSRIDTTNDGGQWPAGSYCIYRKGGTCPTGFESGYIQMDDAVTSVTNKTTGELPDGVYGDNTRWEFCCRNDGPSSSPIELPTIHPFILFENSSCQAVKGMRAQREYFTYRNDDNDNYVEYSGSLPYMYKFSEYLFNMYFCYYAPVNRSGSQIIELTEEAPELTLTLANVAGLEVTNTVLAPEGSKVLIEFNSFDIDCGTDSLQIGFSMPGHPGKQFCGSGFETTIISSENYARFTLRTDVDSKSTGFEAVLKLVTDNDLCYTNGGTDDSYSGTVSYTKNMEPCLPWNEVMNCRFHRFSPETFDDDLSENYCRNTGLGTDPWCYTNAETCARDYCDGCSIRKCYDLFDDCAALIAADSLFCTTNLDGQALRGCRQSCGMCPSNSTDPVNCSTPGVVDGASPSPMKNSYQIGEQVEYHCGNDVRLRTCTSTGEWTHLGFVCGACPNGWGRVDGLCYKWFDVYQSRTDAAATCNSNYDSTLAIVKTEAQNNYIVKIVEFDEEEMDRAWLGMNRNSGDWIWDDGSTIEYSNWGGGEPYSRTCAYIDYDGEWITSSSCSQQRTFVCTHTPGQQTSCADQISNCEDMISSTPDLCVRQTDFAEANCPYSCGLCNNTVSILRKREAQVADISTSLYRRSDISIARSIKIQSQGGLVRGQYRRQIAECTVFVTTTTEPTTTTEEPTTTTTTPTTTTTTSTSTTTTPTTTTTTPTTTTTTTPTTTTTTPTTTTTTPTTTTTTPTTTTTTPTTTTTTPTTTTTTPTSTTTTPTTTTTTSTTTTTTPTTTTTTPTSTTTTSTTTTTTTEQPLSGICSYPGTPAGGSLLTPPDESSITVGNIYEFKCDDGFALSSGELTRACLLSGELTGQPPVCDVRSNVPEPVNNVNIRRRSSHGAVGYIYTAYNDDMLITKAGYITSWRFYSSYDGKLSLQVWRFNNNEALEGLLVGQNVIEDTGEDRVRTIDIPEVDQISVQVGDVLGLHYDNGSPGGLPYTPCQLAYESSQGNQRYVSNTAHEDMIVGNQYTFSQSSSTCMTWSLNAFVK